MGSHSEEYKLIMRVQGAADVKSLKDEIRAEEQALLAAAAAHGQHSAQSRANAANVADLTAKLKAAETAAFGAGGGTRDFGRSLLEGSRALEDLQYGIGGVLNNLPGLVSAMGGSAGLAGAISVAAVAGVQLYKHWDDLMGLFGGGKTKTQADEMKELGDQTSRTADEAERLSEYNALKNKTAELRSAKTESEKKSEDIATKAITDAGVKDVVSGVKKTAKDGDLDSLINVDVKAGVTKAQSELARIRAKRVANDEAVKRGGPADPELPIMEDAARVRSMEARKAYNQARDAAAETLTSAGAVTQHFTPEQLKAMVDSNPAAFGPHAKMLSEGLGEAKQEQDKTPEQRAQHKIDEEESGIVDEQLQDSIKAMADQRKKREKLADDEYALGEQILQDSIKSQQDGIRKRAEKEKRSLDLAEEEDRVAQEQLDDSIKAMEDAKTKREKRVKDTQEEMPGLSGSLQSQLLQRESSGQSPEAAKKALSDALAEGLKQSHPKLSDDQRQAIAEGLVKDAQKELDKDVARTGEKLDDPKEAKKDMKSEVVGATEMWQKIQSSIGGQDVQTKQLSVQEQMLQALLQRPDNRQRLGLMG